MSVSDTNRVQLAYVEETVFGEQVTGSNLQILRHTGETLKQETGIQVSQEIRSDRQIADVARTSIHASGQINYEMSYGAYDDLLAAALLSAAWSSPETVGPITTIAAVATGNTFTDSGNGLADLDVGQWIKVSGFSNAANNGFFKLVSVAAGEIQVSGGTLEDEAASPSVTITQGGQIVNGTTKTSFNIERTFSDLSGELSLFTGMMVDTLSLNAALNAMITGSVGFIGSREESLAASGGTGYDAAATGEVMNGVDDITGLLENGVAVNAQSLGVNLANNLRAREKLGNLGAFDMGTGTVNVTGTLEAYFESATMFDKYLNCTATSLSLVLLDGAGNAYVIDLPNVRFTDGSRQAGAQNQDVLANLSFQAFRHATEDVTIRIARFPAA